MRPELVKLWNNSTLEERQQMLAFVARPAAVREFWYGNVDVLRTLYAGSGDWMHANVHFVTGPAIDSDEAMAQHGIRLPAGITDWDPMQGSSSRIGLLRFPAGFQVDDRRADAPAPAANRLYISKRDGSRVAVPVGRALLRLALSIRTEHQSDAWFAQFCDSISAVYWDEIAFIEAPLLRQHDVRYAIYHDEDDRDAPYTGAELRERFGSVVPFSGDADRDGLSDAGVNRLLLGDKVRYERDGVWYVDLDSQLEEPAVWPDL